MTEKITGTYRQRVRDHIVRLNAAEAKRHKLWRNIYDLKHWLNGKQRVLTGAELDKLAKLRSALEAQVDVYHRA